MSIENFQGKVDMLDHNFLSFLGQMYYLRLRNRIPGTDLDKIVTKKVDKLLHTSVA